MLAPVDGTKSARGWGKGNKDSHQSHLSISYLHPSDSFASPTDEILILMFLDKIKSKSTNEFIRKFVQNKEMESLSDAYGKSFRRLTVSVRVYF